MLSVAIMNYANIFCNNGPLFSEKKLPTDVPHRNGANKEANDVSNGATYHSRLLGVVKTTYHFNSKV